MFVVYILLILLCIYIICIMFKTYPYDVDMFWYNFLKYPLGLLFKFYYPFKCVNQEYAKVEGPVIYCGNHIHLMDQCLVILKTPRPIHFMAKQEYFLNKKVSWFFKMVHCIPVNRKIHDDEAKNQAMAVLENDKALGLFPEGTRNKTDNILQPFKLGAVSFAKKTGATIIPFTIKGEYKFRTKNLKITFLPPFKVGNLSLEEENQRLYDIILNNLKEES